MYPYSRVSRIIIFEMLSTKVKFILIQFLSALEIGSMVPLFTFIYHLIPYYTVYTMSANRARINILNSAIQNEINLIFYGSFSFVSGMFITVL